MLAVLSVLLVALVSLLITRLATIALMLTGMSQDAARFQARSALTGTGFTTSESEGVLRHPVRRRIVMALMLTGGAGVLTALAGVIVGLTDTSRGEAFLRIAVLLGGIGALILVSRTQAFSRVVTPLLTRLLNRYTDIEAQDYAGLLHVGGDWSVGQAVVDQGSWLACERLGDLDLRSEGVVALGIERGDGEYLGAPVLDTRVDVGDVLTLYGRRERLQELATRRRGSDAPPPSSSTEAG